MKGVDAAFDLSPYINGLRDAGIGFCARYYSYNPAKDLTVLEANALGANGFRIVTVFESAGDHYQYFTEAQGTKDAQQALARADACGQPKGTAIYFAVDFDATTAEVEDGITSYFTAAKAGLGGNYSMGVYGSGGVLAALRDAGLVSFLWLAQSRGWRGTAGFTGEHIHQGNATNEIIGMAVDTDESLVDDFGSWVLGEAPVEPAPAPSVASDPPPTHTDIRPTIIQLQQQLRALGFYNGAIDGDPGPQTQAALEAWRGRET